MLFYFCHLKKLVRQEAFGPYVTNTPKNLSVTSTEMNFNTVLKVKASARVDVLLLV